MQDIAIPRSLADVSRDWVESALGRAEGGPGLPAFRLEPLEANNSTTARLIFAERPRQDGLPESMILRLCPEGHGFLGASEPYYYLRDYIGLAEAPIVTCHAAVFPGVATNDSAGNGYALFLADLTGTWTDNKKIRPNETHAERLGAALGRLHAHRWGRDADPDGPHDMEAEFGAFMAHVSTGLDPILEEAGDALSAGARATLARAVTEDAPRMLERAMRGRGLALLHGDPNPTNVLTPRDGAEAKGPPLYLIDRQPFVWSLRLWLGAADLVHASVPYWTEETSRALRPGLMRSYYRALIDNGVRDYSPEDLQADWDFCACMAALKAVEWGSDPDDLTQMKWLWSRQIDRALAVLREASGQ